MAPTKAPAAAPGYRATIGSEDLRRAIVAHWAAHRNVRICHLRACSRPSARKRWSRSCRRYWV